MLIKVITETAQEGNCQEVCAQGSLLPPHQLFIVVLPSLLWVLRQGLALPSGCGNGVLSMVSSL